MIPVAAVQQRSPDWHPNSQGASDWDDRVSRIVPDQIQRGWKARAECNLWLAVVEDAKSSAVLLGRRRRLLGMDERGRSMPAALELEIDRLRFWCEAEFVGSLRWIADQVAGASGVEIQAGRVRREILASLGGNATAGPDARRSRAAARGKAKIVRFSDL